MWTAVSTVGRTAQTEEVEQMGEHMGGKSLRDGLYAHVQTQNTQSVGWQVNSLQTIWQERHVSLSPHLGWERKSKVNQWCSAFINSYSCNLWMFVNELPRFYRILQPLQKYSSSYITVFCNGHSWSTVSLKDSHHMIITHAEMTQTDVTARMLKLECGS